MIEGDVMATRTIIRVAPAWGNQYACHSYFRVSFGDRSIGGFPKLSITPVSRDAWSCLKRRTINLRLPRKTYFLQFDYVG